MHQAARFEKMLAFLREGVDKVDTLAPPTVFITVGGIKLSKKWFS